MKTGEAPLGGGGLSGARVGFSTTPVSGEGGDASPAGAGDGVISVEFEGEGAVAFLLVLSANTITTTFSFLRQLSLLPLMK